MTGRNFLPRLAAALWAGLVVLWLADVAAGAPVLPYARGLTLLALVALAAAGSVGAWRLWNAPAGEPRARRAALVAILALAVLIRFAGLDFELMDAPIGDEGVFHKVSLQINEGDPFPRTFNYGHLLYYLGAFAMWFFELFPVAVARLYELFYTTVEGYGVQRLLLKTVSAGLGALTAGAVFGATYRVLAPREGEQAGCDRWNALVGAGLAGLLVVFSPLYNDVSHQLIADVPAGAFAAFCLYFVSRLLREERLSDYLLAGAASGLAAAGKYPGGVVAVAIFAVWLMWRIRERNWSWSLLWSALASIGALVATMPAVFVYPEIAFRGEGLDIFFGFRQYAYGGWIGVQPKSNLVWYGREIGANFGWPALILGTAGVALLTRASRRRWFWMAVFPATYLTLIFSMSMVVHRNLQVALPALAVLLGCGLAAILAAARAKGRGWAWLALFAVMALPVFRTVAWDVSRMRPGTRQLARQWLEENVPEGASIVRERYSPKLDARHWAFDTLRFAAWKEPAELRSGEWEYLILAKPSYGRFVESDAFRADHQRELKERYEVMFGFPQVAEFGPSAFRAGPLLTLYALEPESPIHLEDRTFLPVEATFISNPELRRDGPEAPLQYTRRWQFAVFKDFFREGSYMAELGMNPPPKEGYLHVVDRRNREIGTFDLRTQISFELPADEKYLFRVFIAPPTRLYGLRLTRSRADGDSEPASGPGTD